MFRIHWSLVQYEKQYELTQCDTTKRVCLSHSTLETGGLDIEEIRYIENLAGKLYIQK